MIDTEAPVWTCPDGCGTTFQTHTVKGLTAANDHWQVCSTPSAETLKHRQRRGLDPNIIPLSPTALDDYETCPRQSWYKTQDPERVRTASGAPAELGTALHTYAETGEEMPAALPATMLEDFLRLRDTLDRLRANDPRPDVPSVEFHEQIVEWEYPMGDGRRVQFQGKLDRVVVYDDGWVLIDDYKSGRVVPETAEDMMTKTNQGRSYPVAVLRLFPFAERIMFRQAQLREHKLLPSEWLTVTQVHEYDALLAAKARGYASEKRWTPTPGHQCLSRCDYIHRCQAGLAFKGQGFNVTVVEAPAAPTDAQGLSQLFTAWEFTKAAAKAMEDVLKATVKKDGRLGPTTLPDGRVLRWWQKPTSDIKDTRAFAAYLEELGINPWEFISFDQRKASVKHAKESAPEGLVEAGTRPEFAAKEPPKAKQESRSRVGLEDFDSLPDQP